MTRYTFCSRKDDRTENDKSEMQKKLVRLQDIGV